MSTAREMFEVSSKSWHKRF